tara:strand:- start:219 stop:653 length:435 start_codon:yes stop_codon:yes gene_type:complete
MTDEELKQAIEELNDAKAEQRQALQRMTEDAEEMGLYEQSFKEFKAVADAYGKKETAQDIATTEKNIALLREEMQQEERDAELRVCVKEFFEKYLNRTEESDGGKMFHPITVSCCRALMLEPLNKLLERMSELSGAAPKENIYD